MHREEHHDNLVYSDDYGTIFEALFPDVGNGGWPANSSFNLKAD
jgi:hypothetical protein